MYRRTVIAGLALAAAAAARVPAQAGPDVHARITDVTLRVNGPITIVAGDSASTVVVVNHDARVDGAVREQLVVVNGTARVTGRVEQNIVVVNGRLELAPTARVERDVLLYRSTLAQSPGSLVAGAVHREVGASFNARAARALWIGLTAAILAGALAVAALAGRQMVEAARLVAAHPSAVTLTTLALWFGLPLLAMLAAATVIGIPLGGAIVLFVIPTLTFAGYLVAATGIGRALLGRLTRDEDHRGEVHPYLAIATGVLIMQTVALVPGLGGLAVLLASLAGAGALTFRSVLRWRRSPVVRPVVAAG
jgi:hypothetical protein